mgnify:CR=1 FL=1
MKFVVEGADIEKPVKVTMGVDCAGDVEVSANGVTVLYITTEGYLLRCYQGGSLKSMGFKVNKEGQIETMDE